MKPVVAIVGRPNVGKSTLFNRISGERRSLVDDMPGVTRDRLYNEVTWNDRAFLLIDTGGFEPTTDEPLLAQMREQTELAIQEADVILFLMDARDGLTASDVETAQRLRRTSKPVHYVVNKVDGARHEGLALEFHALGADPLHEISAQHGRGVWELLDKVTGGFPAGAPSPATEEDTIRVAVVGRPNVGKSSLVNRLCGKERLLVTPIPGTTHDSVDTVIRWYGKRLVLIDTAGIRRKSRTHLSLEKFCVIKALKSVDQCHVALLLLDGPEGVTDQDARIGGYVVERGRGCVLVLNKWDLVSKDHRTHDRVVAEVRSALPHLNFAPILTVSALTGQRVRHLLEWVQKVHEAGGSRISTSRLNEALQTWTREHVPPVFGRRRIKFYYMAQPEVRPPTFVAFTNAPGGVPEAYRRYLIRRIRETFDFTGTPILLQFRPRSGR